MYLVPDSAGFPESLESLHNRAGHRSIGQVELAGPQLFGGYSDATLVNSFMWG